MWMRSKKILKLYFSLGFGHLFVSVGSFVCTRRVLVSMSCIGFWKNVYCMVSVVKQYCILYPIIRFTQEQSTDSTTRQSTLVDKTQICSRWPALRDGRRMKAASLSSPIFKLQIMWKLLQQCCRNMIQGSSHDASIILLQISCTSDHRPSTSQQIVNSHSLLCEAGPIQEIGLDFGSDATTMQPSSGTSVDWTTLHCP